MQGFLKDWKYCLWAFFAGMFCFLIYNYIQLTINIHNRDILCERLIQLLSKGSDLTQEEMREIVEIARPLGLLDEPSDYELWKWEFADCIPEPGLMDLIYNFRLFPTILIVDILVLMDEILKFLHLYSIWIDLDLYYMALEEWFLNINTIVDANPELYIVILFFIGCTYRFLRLYVLILFRINLLRGTILIKLLFKHKINYIYSIFIGD